MSLIRRFLFPQLSMETRNEQMREILGSLKRQIPFLYAVLLTNLVGLHVATRGLEAEPAPPVIAMGALLAWRMIYWTFLQKPIDRIVNLERELFRIAFATTFISAIFAVWVQTLLSSSSEQVFAVVLYSTLMTLGAAVALSSFTSAAIMPLVLVGIPVAGRLLFMGDLTLIGIGVSFVLALLLSMRLLHYHGRALNDLVVSRIETDRERDRAIAAETAALQRAGVDGLTGLANRDTFMAAVEKGLVRASATRPGSLLVLFDLDFFKPANDAYGHAAGDAILAEIAERLMEAFGPDALIARVGGDEFALFWADGLPCEKIAEVGETICRVAARPVNWNGKSLSVSASCGLSEAGTHTTSVVEFLRQADSALYKVKTSGRSGWRIYNEQLFEADRRRKEIEGLLLNGQATEEVEVHFQPIIEIATGRVVTAEALARWESSELGSISPTEFIHVAEQLGLIRELNDAILKRALQAASYWPTEISLSFNLSAVQLGRLGAAERLLAILKNASFSPERVQFEITETAILADIETAQVEMDQLREAGCKLALDDFGAGQTSVGYLRDLSFDVVKFDGSLSSKIVDCPRARHVLRGLVQLCHSVGAKCVAEHIETSEQLSYIEEMGCELIQGHLFKPSASASEFLEFLGESEENATGRHQWVLPSDRHAC